MIDIGMIKNRKNESINDEVIITIINKITSDFDLIEQMAKNENVDIKLAEITNHLKLVTNLSGNTYKNNDFRITNKYIPYGVVGVSINNKLSIYQVIEIIDLLLITHNSIVINYKYMNYTLKLIIDCINKVLELIEDTNLITVTNEEIINLNFDLLLYIGKRDEYEKIDNKIEKKYYGIGNYELYIDEVINQEMIEDCIKNGVKVLYKEANEESFIMKINEITDGYCVSIMCKDGERVRKYVDGIKANYILVNINPCIENRINIDVIDLVKKTSIVTYSK